jgi:hypothetical protein
MTYRFGDVCDRLCKALAWLCIVLCNLDTGFKNHQFCRQNIYEATSRQRGNTIPNCPLVQERCKPARPRWKLARLPNLNKYFVIEVLNSTCIRGCSRVRSVDSNVLCACGEDVCWPVGLSERRSVVMVRSTLQSQLHRTIEYFVFQRLCGT